MENNRAQWGSQRSASYWRRRAAPSASATSGSSPARPLREAEAPTSSFIWPSYVLIGFPVMLSELTIGRAAQANAIDSFHKLGYRGFKWVGVTGVAVAFIVTSYYCHVGGWVLRYVVSYITEAQTVYADPLGYFYGLLGYNAATGETWFPLTASSLCRGIFMGSQLPSSSSRALRAASRSSTRSVCPRCSSFSLYCSRAPSRSTARRSASPICSAATGARSASTPSSPRWGRRSSPCRWAWPS